MGAQILHHPDANLRTADPPPEALPLGYQAPIFAMLQPISYQQQALLESENNRDQSKMKNESVKKSLEKSKIVLEEKLQKRSSKKIA